MSNYEFWDELGKIFNAVVAYQEKTVEFNKRFINPWIRLGNVFDKQDRNEEAIDAYQKALEIDPKNAQNWYEVGNIHFRMGKYEDAVNDFSQAIELDPGFGWPYSNLALTYVSQGKFVEAIPLYSKSIELLEEDKDKAVAWNRLGNVYRKLNEYELAVESFQKADELDQENAGFRDNLDEQPEGPTLVEANADDQEGPAIPVTLSLSELIPAEPSATADISVNSDQPVPAVDASTEAPTVPVRVVVDTVEAVEDTQPAATAEAENEVADSQPAAEEPGTLALTQTDAVDASSDLPVAESQIPDAVVDISDETAVIEMASDSRSEPVDEEVTATSPVEMVVDGSPSLAEAGEQDLENVVVVQEVSIVANEAADVQIAAVEPEAIDAQPATVEAETADAQPAVVEPEASVITQAEEVDETSSLSQVEQQAPEKDVPQESITETAVIPTNEVAATPQPVADPNAETVVAAPVEETVTVVVQSSVETFTETVTITNTSTETSDAALTVETTEETVNDLVAQTEEVVVDPSEQMSEPESVETSPQIVEETIPVETPVSEAASAETDNIETELKVEEPVVEVTTSIVEVSTSVETTIDQKTNIADNTAEQPAYDEYLKDSSDPIHIYESGNIGEAVMIENVPASQEPVAKIDSSGELQIEMDTKNAHVWNELGNVYFNTGAHDDAVTAYSKAIELDRWFAWPYSNLALTYVQKGRFVEAILLYQRSIELFTSEKDKAVSWNRLGNVYRRINDYENAIAAYQRADELDPDNTTLSLQSRFSLLGSFVMEQKPSYVS